jgi:hypothetical protein
VKVYADERIRKTATDIVRDALRGTAPDWLGCDTDRLGNLRVTLAWGEPGPYVVFESFCVSTIALHGLRPETLVRQMVDDARRAAGRVAWRVGAMCIGIQAVCVG